MINRKMRAKIKTVCAMAMALALVMAGCSGVGTSLGTSDSTSSVSSDVSALEASAGSSMELGEITATVTLSDEGSAAVGSGVTIDGSDVIITSGGTFSFTGTLTEGRIKVEAQGQDVKIVLNGVTITNSDKDAIYIEEANSAVVYVMEGTENSLTSGTEETYAEAKAATQEANSSESENANEESSDAADATDSTASEDGADEEEGLSNSQKATIMAKCDLVISGAGTLNVYGYLNNGIQSKTNLTLENVNLTLVAANDGLKGGTDVTITSGVYDLLAVGDAVQSDGTLNIEDGTFTVVTGDGSASVEKKTEMGPGGGFPGGGQMQSGDMPEMPSDMPEMPSDMPEMPSDMPEMPSDMPQMNSGDQAADSSGNGMSGAGFPGGMGMMDDSGDSLDSDSNKVSQKGFKSAGDMTISGGSFNIDTADDAVHAGGTLTVSDGEFIVKTGDDGLHSETDLVIDGGTITIDDCYEGIECATITVNGGDISVTASDDGFNASSSDGNALITLNGGNIYVNSSGDGIDSNKDLVINGGTIYVDGPAMSADSAYDNGVENQGVFVINAGTVTGLGSAEMLENTDETSMQQTILYAFDESVEAGTEITISDSKGNVVASFTTVKSSASILYSSTELKSGETYTITAGDQSGELTTDAINATNYEGRTMGGGQGGPGGNGQGGPGGNGQAPQGQNDAGQSSSGNGQGN